MRMERNRPPVEPKKPVSPQEWHNFEDLEVWWQDHGSWMTPEEFIDAAATIGNWDAQIATLKANGHLNGKNTTYDKKKMA